MPLFFLVGDDILGIPKKDDNQTNPLYVILSGEKRLRFAESKFCGVNNGAKPRSECDEGIWQGVWVAFYRKCYIDSKATEILSHILLRLRLALLLVRFAQPAKVRLRASHSAQNDRLIVCFVICVCFCETFSAVYPHTIKFI